MSASKLWYLSNMDIFSGLSREEYAVIDRDSASRALKKRETLPFQGTSERVIYFIKKGKIKLLKLTAGGRAVALDILNEGTLFGEVNSVLAGHGEDLIAEALEDCLLCEMSKGNFDRLMGIVPTLSKKVLKIIGFRFKKVENRLTELLYNTVEVRLAKTLLGLREDFGVQENNRLLLKVKLTHNDLAELVASTRETLTLTMNDFRAKGFIDYEKRCIILLDEQGLQGLADSL